MTLLETKTHFGARRRARECALQTLYSLDTHGILSTLLGAAWGDETRVHVREQVEQTMRQFWMQPVDNDETSMFEFAGILVWGALEHLRDIDGHIQQASQNWRLERMTRVDRNILRLATFELCYEPETPANVIMNEAIELAKRYGTTESPAFVNGLIDKVALCVTTKHETT